MKEKFVAGHKKITRTSVYRRQIKGKLRLWFVACGTVGILLFLKALPSTISRSDPIVKETSRSFQQTEPTSDKVLKRDRQLLEFVEAIETISSIKNLKTSHRLPDMIIAGVEKCGTGALRQMISYHPMVRSPKLKEMHFFNGKMYEKGISYYKSMMPKVTSYEMVFEKTPAYFNWRPKDIPKMIHDSIKNVKIVIILCDPVNRTFSDFAHDKARGSIPKITILQAYIYQAISMVSVKLAKLADDDYAISDYIMELMGTNVKSHTITTGLYYYHLLRWFKAFNRSDIHIIDGEKLISHPGNVMEELQEFLKIPKFIISEDFVPGPRGFQCFHRPYLAVKGGIKMVQQNKTVCMDNRSKGRTRMGNWNETPDKSVVNMLRRFYAPHNRKLYKLLGRNFKWQ